MVYVSVKTYPRRRPPLFPPSRLPTAAPKPFEPFFFEWEGEQTTTRRGHIACANSLSEGVEEDRMEGSTLLVQAFMGSFIYAQPLSLFHSLTLALSTPIPPPPASQTGFMVGL